MLLNGRHGNFRLVGQYCGLEEVYFCGVLHATVNCNCACLTTFEGLWGSTAVSPRQRLELSEDANLLEAIKAMQDGWGLTVLVAFRCTVLSTP